MRRFVYPIVLLSTVVVMSCGNGGSEADAESDTTSTVATDTAMGGMADTIGTAGTTGTTYSSTPLTGADTTFVKEAASAGLMEVELGRLAQQNATSPRVKSFGEMMVRDHSQANNELKSMATAKNMMLPDSMMKKHRDHVERLRNVTGSNFDKRYMEMMVKDHTEDVQKFEKASNTATDPDLKGFAGRTVPTLRMHLDSAKAINQAKM